MYGNVWQCIKSFKRNSRENFLIDLYVKTKGRSFYTCETGMELGLILFVLSTLRSPEYSYRPYPTMMKKDLL